MEVVIGVVAGGYEITLQRILLVKVNGATIATRSVPPCRPENDEGSVQKGKKKIFRSRRDSNARSSEPKSDALPLGHET